MERDNYFDFDSVPSDILRLIFKQLRALTDLRSFNSINKSCHNYSKYYMQHQNLWLRLCKKMFGWDGTSFTSSILPSKLYPLKQMLRPPLHIDRNITGVHSAVKIVVVGDGGVGKSTYTKLISRIQPDPRYIPNIALEVRDMVVTSRNQTFNIKVWDTAGQEKFGALRDGYYIGANAAIVIADVTSRLTVKNIPMWVRDVRRVCGDIPVAICLNKMDAPNVTIKSLFITAIKFAKKANAMFCEMSNWAKYNVHEPLIWIMQQLTGDDALELTFAPLSSDNIDRTAVIDDSAILNTMLHLRKKGAGYSVEDEDDDFLKDSNTLCAKNEVKTKDEQIIDTILHSCSPRVKSVMESLLTGVTTGPALANKHHPLQRPSLLFVEGLSCSEFHPIQNFNFVQPLLEFYKQHEDAITMEAKNLMARGGLDDMTSSVNGSWKSFYFVESGRINHTSTDTAPLLTQMVRGVSPSLMTCSFGYAYISILGPHSHITPHCGPCNIKLRCHLPLIVPSEGCTLRVGSTIKSFKQGELLIFDDSIEHEVHNNDSSSSRVILLFDIWHPDLTTDEINSFNTYFN